MEANEAFASKYQFPYPLLSDLDGAVCQSYGSCSPAGTGRAKRDTIIIDSEGKVQRIFRNVIPEGHIDEVLAFLDTAAAVATGKKQGGRYQGAISSAGPGGNEFMEAQGQNKESGRDPAVEKANASTVVSKSATGLRGETLAPTTLPEGVYPAQAGVGPQLVFALGKLGYDFGTESRRDSIGQHMDGSVNNPSDLLAFLDDHPDQATSVIWTLNLDATPIYAILPHGPFAIKGYERLRQFLSEQLTEGVERVSIPGRIIGQTTLLSGQSIPVIVPELRCMYSWSTAALIKAVCGEPPAEPADNDDYSRQTGAVTNFLQRIYDEMRNLGISSQDRALNYAGSNVASANSIFTAALNKKLELHSIVVKPSPICRAGSDCWDVQLIFFDPENVLRAKSVHQFTVDVSDVCPHMVGRIRFWSMP